MKTIELNLNYLFFLLGFIFSVSSVSAQTEKYTSIIYLKSKDSIVCQGLTFRESKGNAFQYWTEPNVQNKGAWAFTPIIDIKQIEFGNSHSDGLNTYVDVKLILLNEMVKTVYTMQFYSFSYPDKKLPSGENTIAVSEIKSIRFIH